MVVERVLVESRKSEIFGEIIKLMMTQMWLLNIFFFSGFNAASLCGDGVYCYYFISVHYLVL